MDHAWWGTYFFQLGSRNYQSKKNWTQMEIEMHTQSTFLERLKKKIWISSSGKEDEIYEISTSTSKVPKENRSSNEKINMMSIYKPCSRHNDSLTICHHHIQRHYSDKHIITTVLLIVIQEDRYSLYRIKKWVKLKHVVCWQHGKPSSHGKQSERRKFSC